MRILHSYRGAFGVVAAFAMAACGDSTAPDSQPVTIDQVFADLNEVQSVTAGALAFGGVPVASHAMPASASCTYNATTQSFTCPPGTASGVTFSRSFQLFDASNNPQSAFNPATTAAIATVSDAAGTFTSNQGSITFTAHEAHRIDGLLEPNLTIAGESTLSLELSNGSESGTIDATTTIAGLVIPKRRGPGRRYPLDGTITTNIAVTNGADETHNLAIALEFDGTSIATMTLTSAAGTLTCQIDMSKQAKHPSCS